MGMLPVFFSEYLRNFLTLSAPTLQNGQTHSNNSMVFDDELFECVSPFCGIGALKAKNQFLVFFGNILHCEKYRNFTWFPGVEILQKGTVSPETIRKLRLSTKFPHQEIRSNYHIFLCIIGCVCLFFTFLWSPDILTRKRNFHFSVNFGELCIATKSKYQLILE